MDYILRCFREMLTQKKYSPGDLIPNETELAKNMGVSRSSIREAMKILSAFGIIEIKRGDGTYISENLGESILDPFLLNLLMSGQDIREMAELREMIELQVVKLAVKNAGEKDIENLSQLTEEMRQKTDSGELGDTVKMAEADIAFHNALGNATGNALVAKLYRFIMGFFRETIEKTYADINNIKTAYSLHAAIYSAIAERNEEKALSATAASIKAWEERNPQRSVKNDN